MSSPLGVVLFGVKQDGTAGTTMAASVEGRGGVSEKLADYRIGVMTIARRRRKALARAINLPDGSPARIRALSSGEN